MIIQEIYQRQTISTNRIVRHDNCTAIHVIWVRFFEKCLFYKLELVFFIKKLIEYVVLFFTEGGDPRNLMSVERQPGQVPNRPMNLGLDMTPPRKLPQPLIETKTDYSKYR